MQQRYSDMASQLVDFGRFLRKNNPGLNLERQALALEHVGHHLDHASFRLYLKLLFCNNSQNFQDFDALFDSYFKSYKQAVDAKDKTKEQNKHQAKNTKESDFQSLKDWLYGKQNSKQEEVAAYGGQLLLLKKDFAGYTDADIDAARRIIKVWAKKYRSRKSRRKLYTHSGGSLHLAASMRKNFRKGSDIDELVFATDKPKAEKLLILADVSKSMELYSGFFIQIIYAFHEVFKHMHTYVFSHDLSEVSSALAKGAFENSLKSIANEVFFWGGTTRIAHCFMKLCSQGIHRVADKKTTIIIISDGLDADGPAVLVNALKCFKKQAKRIIWLNPLAGFAGYKAETDAMKAAMPYIDRLYSGHNLASFKTMLMEL